MAAEMVAKLLDDFVCPSRPTGRKRRRPTPSLPGEQLLAEVLGLLMHLDDTNTVDAATVAMLETLPWEQIRLLRDRLVEKSHGRPVSP